LMECLIRKLMKGVPGTDPFFCFCVTCKWSLSVSSSFMLIVSWWLSYNCRCCLQLWESQNDFMHSQKCHIFMTWKNPGRLAFWTIFCRTLDKISLKPIKQGKHCMHYGQWHTQKFCLWGEGSTNSVANKGQRERGSGGSSPLVRGSAQFVNKWNRYSY
jgi:hypothetical protein